tara:strand:- start:91303 stop:92259 length:957 start_codon:yes stop_codon:yes gene_type:complete
MQKKEIAINVENLSKIYKNGVKAISGVSFSVNFGEIFGLLGPNGAGKSSTVRILSTLSNLSDGSAHIAGQNVTKSPTEVRLLTGYVAQSTGVDAWATGKENLLLQAQLERVPRKKINKRVDNLLEWVGLSSVSRKLVKTYSGGMKRRLEIAMGLVHEPKVLFLDEPSTGLDPESRRKLWNDLKYLQKQKKITVLLTTHYLEEADYLCDRIAIIDKGKIVAKGTPSDLKSKISSDIVTLEIDNQIDLASNILTNLHGVNSTNVEDDKIVLQVNNGKKILPSLVLELQKKSINIVSFSFNSPSLDDVYLKFTGHMFEKDN